MSTPNLTPILKRNPQNLIDLDFSLSISLKVKSHGAVGLPIYDFLLVSNSNHISISHNLAVTAAQNSPIPYRYQLGQHLGLVFFKIEWFSCWVSGKTFTKNEVH